MMNLKQYIRSLHPFIDGNGRTESFLVNLDLMKAEPPLTDIKFTERLAYYKAFDDYRANHCLETMEDLFAGSSTKDLMNI